MKPLKILVTGAVGSGKTTLVATLSEIEPVRTDVESKETPDKPFTTVGLDYGSMTVHDMPVNLFGTPGQERFGYMWDVLGEGVDGIVLLVNASNDSAVADTERLLSHLLTKQEAVPLAVGITHTDVDESHPEQVRAASFTEQAISVDAIDAGVQEDSEALVAALVAHITRDQ
ncbi:MAG: ADP-ribosylation factor-like protein [Longimonas sp.]|uniref:GTP-binding protein n=1 Tax=Longimonas sp. TaxID=2039626 RepID=UPI003974D7A1